MSTETIVTNKATRRGDTRPGLFTERPGGVWDLNPPHPVLGAHVLAHLALPGDDDQDLPAEVAVFAATPEGEVSPDFDEFEFVFFGETELARRVAVDTEVAAFGVLGYEVVA